MSHALLYRVFYRQEALVDATGVSTPVELSVSNGAQVSGTSRERWPKEAYEVVASYLARLRHSTDVERDGRVEMKRVIAQLAALTGRSRQNCRRFARRLGVMDKQPYQEWTKSDQQQLLELISKHPACEVARRMRRSPGSVRAMLHRLGASAQMGHDWFTIYTLAEALHTRGSVVQSWINSGWLKARIVETGRLRKEIIEADAFAEFCKQHGKAVVGRRLRADRLEFVKNFVFPASHSDLLPVRESKKERAAFDAMMGSPAKAPEEGSNPQEGDGLAGG